MEQKREKRLKTNEENFRELWDNIKCTNFHIIGVPEGEEREKGTEKIVQEIIAKNFPNMGKKPLTQIQEAQRVPHKQTNKQTKTKEEHPKIHLNLCDQN